MIDMIVIDDEPYIHTVLADFIDYEKIGIRLAANATSAEEAMKMITPDIKIAVIDIKMPGMSGTDFVEYAVDKYPWLKFIVLSGYDDFKYVRKIFRYGATDYFLKSELEPESFEKSLKEAAEMITAETSVRNNEDKIKKCISGLINDANYPIEYDAMLWEFEKLQRRIMALKILDCTGENAAYENAEELYEKIDDILEKELAAGAPICIKRFADLYIIVVDTGMMGKSYFEIYDRISSRIRNEVGRTVNAGLSEKFQSLAEVNKMYEQAITAVEYCYIAGNGRMVMYSAYQCCSAHIDEGKIIGKIRDYLYSMQFDKLRAYIPEAFGMTDVSLNDTENVKQLISQSRYEIKNYISHNFPESAVIEEFQKGKSIAENGDVQSFVSWFASAVQKISEEKGKYSGIVSRAIAYAHKNYADPELKLNNLAQNELFVTYNHLSRVFKAETGMSFNRYLTQIRMKKAMELLQEGEYKLYEIAEMVGYKNYENFSRTFKEYYNTSPKFLFRGKQ